MTEPLVQPEDLNGFTGAPFAATVVAAVAADIRGTVQWHIAPEQPATFTLQSAGGPHIFLPTMWLVSVTEIRNITGDTPVVVDDWDDHPTVEFRAGILTRRWGWPCGTLEVDAVHGYEQCPADLLPVLANRCRAARIPAGASVRLASLSISGGGTDTDTDARTIARYRIPGVG